jgi:hypothetical protein
VAFLQVGDAVRGAPLGASALSRCSRQQPLLNLSHLFVFVVVQDLGLLTGAHASVVNRVAAEAQALDQAIRGGK